MQKIIEFHIKVKDELKSLLSKLKKNYKLHLKNYHLLSEFRDFVMCLILLKENAEHSYNKIQSLISRFDMSPAAADLEILDNSDDSYHKEVLKKEGIYNTIF